MTMEKQVIASEQAPKALGPYSQAIRAGNMVFTSGQVPIDPATGELISWEITEQVRQVFRNIKAVLAAAGLSLNDVVKTTVFLADINDFATMNEVYATFFPSVPPARSTFQVAKLPLNALVEIETIATL